MADPFRPWLDRPAERLAEPSLADPATPWLTVIGIGDGGLETLTAEARAALDAAGTVFGGERHLAMLGDWPAQTVAWARPFAESLDLLRNHAGTPTVVLASGDPMWFGVGASLTRQFSAGEMLVIPAASAFQLAAARLAWPLADCRCLTVHGRPPEIVNRHLAPAARLLIHSEHGASPQIIARLLTGRGFGPSRLVVLEHLGGTRERIRETTAAGFDVADIADLNTVAVECIAGRAATPRPLAAGLPDDAFVHDGKMTKRVLRALAIAALEPLPGQRLWDVGAGCGSVSVEWLRCGGGEAVAIEPVAERRAMIAENAATLGAPEIEIVAAQAPAAFEGLAPPDAVFIGGGLGDGVFDAAWDALKPGGRMVAHAVTLESEAILIALHARLGGELLRIGVERAEKVGPYRGFKPAMPVVHSRHKGAWLMREASGTLYGLGVGPGDPELLTLKALRILKAAPLVAYPAPEGGSSFARAIVAEHLSGEQEEIAIVVPMRVERFPAANVYDEAARRIGAALASGRDVAVLCEGDPFFYGSFMYLFERLAGRYPAVIVPGVSSLTAAAAAVRRPLAARNDVLTVIPGPLDDAVLSARIEAAEAFAIIKLGRHFARVTALLSAMGMTRSCVYAERVSLPEERILPLDEAEGEAPYFSMILGYRGGEPAIRDVAFAAREFAR